MLVIQENPDTAIADATTIEEIDIHKINADNRTQSRVEIDEKTVQSYAAAMKAGAIFPALIVISDGDTWWLVDGCHRLAAARQCGKTKIVAQVCSGTLRDAILQSCSCNEAHGLRPTKKDRRRSIIKVLADPTCSRWSNREVGKLCNVDEGTVRNLKKELSAEFPHMSYILSAEIPQINQWEEQFGVDRETLEKALNHILTPSDELEVRRRGKTYQMTPGTSSSSVSLEIPQGTSGTVIQLAAAPPDSSQQEPLLTTSVEGQGAEKDEFKPVSSDPNKLDCFLTEPENLSSFPLLSEVDSSNLQASTGADLELSLAEMGRVKCLHIRTTLRIDGYEKPVQGIITHGRLDWECPEGQSGTLTIPLNLCDIDGVTWNH